MASRAPESPVVSSEPGLVSERRGGFSCGGGPVNVFEGTYEVTGRKTADAFELLINGFPTTIPISGTQATFTQHQPGAGGYDAEVTFTLYCMTCPT